MFYIIYMNKYFIIIILFYLINLSYSFTFNNYIFIKFLKNNYNLPDPNKYKNIYYYDPRIHNLGNIGLKGHIHSILAPFATILINNIAYNKTNIRYNILNNIPKEYSVLDLCCGVGLSTRNNATGIDTSNQMLNIAKLMNNNNNNTYRRLNAENISYLNNYDVITLMFATHEIPSINRKNIINNALKKTNKYLLIIDIDNNNYYKTLMKKKNNGNFFLSGEPYLIDYLLNMNKDIFNCFLNNILHFSYTKKTLINNHIVLWNFTKRSF